MKDCLRLGFVDYRLAIAHASMLFRRFDQRREAGACAVVGCTALEEEEGRAWAAERGVPYYQSALEMKGEVDAIVIPAASNPEHHPALFAAALELGVPVFIDKPFAQNAEEAFGIFKLAAEKGVPVFSTSSLRFSDEVRQLAEKYPSAHYVQSWGGWSRKFDEFVIHPLETAMSILGADITAVKREQCGESHKITLFYPEGRRGEVIFSPGEQPYEVAACGETGWEHHRISSPFFDRLIDHMLEAFREKRAAVSPRETLAVMKAIDATKLSCEGSVIPIVWSEEEEAFLKSNL